MPVSILIEFEQRQSDGWCRCSVSIDVDDPGRWFVSPWYPTSWQAYIAAVAVGGTQLDAGRLGQPLSEVPRGVPA